MREKRTSRTVDEAKARGVWPLAVFDANGMEIKEKIVGFDESTGEVEFIAGYSPLSGVRTKTDVYPAPLTWKHVEAHT